MRLALLTLALPLLLVGPSQAQDAEAGATVFKKCMACHAVGENARARVGPPLNGVVGHAAGAVAGFKYSEALLGAGITWDEAALSSFLKAPKAFIPGTKMTFVGLKTDEEIANVIAYLKTFDAEGKAVAP